MTREEILNQVKVLVSKISDEEITEFSNLRDDLGFDSLDEIELIMECEKHFEINIPDSEGVEIHTVGQAITAIEKQLQYKKV